MTSQIPYRTIGFHPDLYGLRPEKLAWDSQLPFTILPNWKQYNPTTFLKSFFIGNYVLIGASRGGSFIFKLLEELYLNPPPNDVHKPAAAIIYESPLRPLPEFGLLDIPILFIDNDYNHNTIWHPRGQIVMDRTKEYLLNNNQTDFKTGELTAHTKKVPYFPYRGFGWDTDLNPFIHQWISEKAA